MDIDKFLEKHNINCTDYGIADNLPAYLNEMQRGLNGEGSSLLMLPTYIEKCDNFPADEDIICVDAGGTNLRICLAHFDTRRNLIISDLNRYTMPGVGKTLSSGEFFDTLAELIYPYCEKSTRIGMSFAYRAKTTSNHDAEIIEITKEVSVEGADGMLLGAEILNSLRKKGADNMRIVVINDTVAVALSGEAEVSADGDGVFTGTILGTGSNSCYFEKNSAIGKVQGLVPDSQMLINTEAGSYNLMTRSDLDISYDKSTIHPEIGVFEKMASGGYLGALTQWIIHAAANEGVFSQDSLKELSGLTTPDISLFAENGSGKISEYNLTDSDASSLKKLIDTIIERAARLVALQMSACIAKNNIANAEIYAVIEGSTYEKLTGLKPLLHRYLKEYWDSLGQQIHLLTPESAVLKGCAIAGLSVYPQK